jgi:hypothetical protein
MSPSPTTRWFVAAIASLALAISFLYSPATLPKLELCLLRRITGVPCPAAASRAPSAPSRTADPAAAWHIQPLRLRLSTPPR